MATAEQVQEKAAEFAEAVQSMEAAKAQYELALGPYLDNKQLYIDAINLVGKLDKELEALTQEYEAPAPPT